VRWGQPSQPHTESSGGPGAQGSRHTPPRSTAAISMGPQLVVPTYGTRLWLLHWHWPYTAGTIDPTAASDFAALIPLSFPFENSSKSTAKEVYALNCVLNNPQGEHLRRNKTETCVTDTSAVGTCDHEAYAFGCNVEAKSSAVYCWNKLYAGKFSCHVFGQLSVTKPTARSR
jgi:hypothetical protein